MCIRDRSEVWELESFYIAQALADYIMILSPQKIILGGGVMHQEQLFPLIRRKVKELVNGYICSKELDDIDNYIVPASLNDDQGIDVYKRQEACKMVVELISVGTEILMGNILNSNTQYLAEKCALLGLDQYYQVTVGDNYGQMCIRDRCRPHLHGCAQCGRTDFCKCR